MEDLQAHARSTIVKYNEVLVELKQATKFTEEKDFGARDRILGRVESLLSELENTSIGRGLIRQIYGGYTFPFKEIYIILEEIRTNQINFPQTYTRLNKLSKSVPSLARESLV